MAVQQWHLQVKLWKCRNKSAKQLLLRIWNQSVIMWLNCSFPALIKEIFSINCSHNPHSIFRGLNNRAVLILGSISFAVSDCPTSPNAVVSPLRSSAGNLLQLLWLAAFRLSVFVSSNLKKVHWLYCLSFLSIHTGLLYSVQSEQSIAVYISEFILLLLSAVTQSINISGHESRDHTITLPPSCCFFPPSFSSYHPSTSKS